MIVSVLLVTPVGGVFGAPYSDHPQTSDGYSFELTAHGVRISHPNKPGVSVIEPWHRVLRIRAADPVVQTVDTPVQEPTARTKATARPAAPKKPSGK